MDDSVVPNYSQPKAEKPKKNIVLLAIVAVLILICIVVVIVIVTQSNSKKPENVVVTPAASSTQANKRSFLASYDLSSRMANLSLVEPGDYELTGAMQNGHSVIVNAADEVLLYLNTATIEATKMAAVASISPSALTIELADDTTNELSSSGASDYDGCIYSVGELKITGDTGILYITGSNIDGRIGINAAKGYAIDGGTVIATGSGVLKAPLESSKQNVIAIAFGTEYKAGSKVELISSKDESIFEFNAKDNFTTLILSSADLSYGTYTLSIAGEKVLENISVIRSVTTIDKSNEKPADSESAEASDSTNTSENADGAQSKESSTESESADIQSENGDIYGRIPVDQLPAEE